MYFTFQSQNLNALIVLVLQNVHLNKVLINKAVLMSGCRFVTVYSTCWIVCELVTQRDVEFRMCSFVLDSNWIELLRVLTLVQRECGRPTLDVTILPARWRWRRPDCLLLVHWRWQHQQPSTLLLAVYTPTIAGRSGSTNILSLIKQLLKRRITCKRKIISEVNQGVFVQSF